MYLFKSHCPSYPFVPLYNRNVYRIHKYMYTCICSNPTVLPILLYHCTQERLWDTPVLVFVMPNHRLPKSRMISFWSTKSTMNSWPIKPILDFLECFCYTKMTTGGVIVDIRGTSFVGTTNCNRGSSPPFGTSSHFLCNTFRTRQRLSSH